MKTALTIVSMVLATSSAQASVKASPLSKRLSAIVSACNAGRKYSTSANEFFGCPVIQKFSVSSEKAHSLKTMSAIIDFALGVETRHPDVSRVRPISSGKALSILLSRIENQIDMIEADDADGEAASRTFTNVQIKLENYILEKAKAGARFYADETTSWEIDKAAAAILVVDPVSTAPTVGVTLIVHGDML